MANHSATKKSIRKTITKTAINKSRKTRIKTYIKRVMVAVESGLAQEANKALIEAQSEIMRGVACNLLKKNTGSRKISRLASKVKAISLAVPAVEGVAVKEVAVKTAVKKAKAPAAKKAEVKETTVKKPAAKKEEVKKDA
jgi:small subunit ribosomal protein S20